MYHFIHQIFPWFWWDMNACAGVELKSRRVENMTLVVTRYDSSTITSWGEQVNNIESAIICNVIWFHTVKTERIFCGGSTVHIYVHVLANNKYNRVLVYKHTY